jgi:hypothetical protein
VIPADPTSWVAAWPAVLAVLAVLFVPGTVAAWLLGLRGLASAAVAPALSCAVVGLGGVVWGFVGLDWTPVVLLVLSAGLWLVCWGASALGGRSAAPRHERHSSCDRADQAAGRLAALGGLVLAALLIGGTYVHLTGSASAFSQQPDTIFHLGAAQWMLERGDISSLHASGYSTPTGTGFYPAVWHGVVVSAVQLCGAPVVVVSSALALVASALVWPLGCIMLARLVVGPGAGVTLAAAATSTAATALPFWLWGYGVLWPLLLGFAMLPAALGAVVLLLRPALGPVRGTSALVLVGVSGAGLALAHPSIAIAMAWFAVPAVAERGFELGRRAALACVAGLAVAALGWLAVSSLVPSMRGDSGLGPEEPVWDAFVDTVSLAPRDAPPLWVLAALAAVGAVVLLLRRGARWLVIALVACGALYTLIAGVDSSTTRWLTWPWYNNGPRLASLLVVPAVVVAAAGLAWLGRLLDRLVRRAAPDRSGGRRRWLSWAAALLPPVAFLLLTGGGYVRAHLAYDLRYYEPSVDRSWVSPQELDALRRLAQHIPLGSRVAANPRNGGTYLYPVSGRELLVPTEKAPLDADRRLLVEHLDDAGHVAGVCAAAERDKVRYAITGGRPVGKRTSSEWRHYPGFDGVADSPAFREVESAGPYTLYELTGCPR